MSEHEHKESDVSKSLVSMFGAGADEHGVLPPGASEQSVQDGHEPDRFAVKPILYVPVLVVLTLIGTYIIVTFGFVALYRLTSNPTANNSPQITELNDFPIDNRFARTSSTVPEPLDEQMPDTKVPQPRLEYLKQTGDPEAPPYERSKLPLQIPNNPPEIRPEYLRPNNYVDPKTGQKVLAEYGLIDQDGKLARIPIDEAIKLSVSGDKAFSLPVKSEK